MSRSRGLAGLSPRRFFPSFAQRGVQFCPPCEKSGLSELRFYFMLLFVGPFVDVESVVGALH